MAGLSCATHFVDGYGRVLTEDEESSLRDLACRPRTACAAVPQLKASRVGCTAWRADQARWVPGVARHRRLQSRYAQEYEQDMTLPARVA